ncbi:MAG: T9SS type A sorting domain-containing protein [Ignavibacteriae bacterium]|nr:T9SS type A sorting domain-containing protein [Ignavibacteriota bacterium]
MLGNGGFLRQTFDGGANWENYGYNEAKSDLFDIGFKTQEEGFITGANGLIMRTTDGGKNWYKEETQTSDNFYNIVADTNNVIAITDTVLYKRNYLNNRETYGQALIHWVNPDYDTLKITDVHDIDGVINALEVYPNPVNSVLNLKFSNSGAIDAEIRIVNLIGNELKLYKEKCQTQGTYLFSYNLSDLDNGIYFIHLKTKYGTFVKRVVLIK